MSPPDKVARACEAARIELHALLVDRERPACSATELWEHVAACERCARAVAHDGAMRRALERLRGADRAPLSLRERLRRLIEARRRGAGGGSSPT